MRTIAWSHSDGGCITLLDQRLLPHQTVEVQITDYQELITAIKELAVRGAPALGVAGALGVALITQSAEQQSWSTQRRDEAISQLRLARPTAVNLAWGVDQVTPLINQGSQKVLNRALEIAAEDARANREMGKRGADYLLARINKKSLTILTHCNTGALATTEWGTAFGVIRELHNRGAISEVFADETRPLLQGSRLTAWELEQAKIPHRILPDGAAASALFSGAIDAVLIGADRIAANGDSANKIGSLGVAVVAHSAGIPFLVVAPESTIDRRLETGAEIEIEFRDDREVTHVAGHPVAPIGTRTYNPAFDVTPARFITAIVTETNLYEVSKGERL